MDKKSDIKKGEILVGILVVRFAIDTWYWVACFVINRGYVLYFCAVAAT